jgi:putative addiction module component (TIGR02574 family)
LNPADDSTTDAWLALAKRRLDDMRSGRVEAISGEAVFEKVRRRLEQ